MNPNKRACFLVVGLMFVGSITNAAAAPSAGLSWDRDAGVVLKTSAATVWLDRNDRVNGAVLRFVADGSMQRLTNPTVTGKSETGLKLTYRVSAPGGVTIQVVREIRLSEASSHAALIETFTLHPSQPLATEVQIERPFSLRPKEPSAELQAVFPLKNGWARSFPLAEKEIRGEYRLGNPLTDQHTPHLALPMLSIDGPGHLQAALMADPTFSSLFEVQRKGNELHGSLRYRYAGRKVPLEGTETRRFGVWITSAENQDEPFPAAVDSFFELMLPDVPAGPRWLHEIAMVDYDYLSDGGKGWERDLKALAKWIKPEQRRRVALCLHGWYDVIGSYSYDAKTGRMKDKWVGFGPTQKIPLTPEEMKRRMRVARELGFRVLLYFADGLASDSGVTTYRDDWIYRDANGKPIPGWQGPDTFGPTYWLNPAHPQVSAWFLGYMDTLLNMTALGISDKF